MGANFAAGNRLQFEQLEKRETMAGNITAVALPQLDSVTALSIAPLYSNNPTPEIKVAGTTDGQAFIGTIPLSPNGDLGDTVSIKPAVVVDAVFSQADTGLDTQGGQAFIRYFPGAIQGHPAILDLNGAEVWSDQSIDGKISIIFETGAVVGLVETAAGQQKLMIGAGVYTDIPAAVHVESMLKPIFGETSLFMGGTNTTTGNPTILRFDRNTGAFLEPEDLILGASVTGTVKSLTRAADASDEPIAVVEVVGILPGNVPAVGSVWVNDHSKTQIFGPSNGGKVLADIGVTVYQGDGDWFVQIDSKTMSHLTGLPRNLPIPLSGLLADAGFTDTTVTDVTSIISDGFGRLYIVSDIEVQGFKMTNVLAVCDPAPLQNKNNSLDINDDDFISPIDALIIINQLNLSGSGGVTLEKVGIRNLLPDTERFYFMDTNGDSFISPIDVLIIINYLNQRSNGGEGEMVTAVAGSDSLDSQRVDSALSMPDLIEEVKRRRRS